MVDSIKGKVSPALVATKSADSLRQGFRSLTSGKVSETAVRSSDAVTNLGKSPKKVSNVLSSLNDAVSFSTLALKSLEKLKGDLNESASEGVSLDGLSSGITNLEENVSDVLNTLRKKLDTAQVVSENISSADSKIEDIETAKKQASTTSSQVRDFNEKQVVDAHSGINAARVMDLLSD
jgi:DNA repair ATPase RecN